MIGIKTGWHNQKPWHLEKHHSNYSVCRSNISVFYFVLVTILRHFYL